MAIKRTRTVYVSDRNQEFFLEEMQFSHLLNAYAHHQKQLKVLEEMTSNDFIAQRKSALEETLNVLKHEICTRNPQDDEVKETHRGYYY